MSEGFNVGDRVVVVRKLRYGEIGTITKITEKRKDVVVDFGKYTGRYGLDGWSKGDDAWTMHRIVVINEKVAQEIADQNAIRDCMNLIDDITYNNLTPGLARKLVAVIKAEKEGE